MARSFTDALLAAGLIRPEDTPAAREERAWRERQEARAQELQSRMDDPTPLPEWETGATRPETVPSAGPKTAIDRPRPPACAECGEPFDPDSVENRPGRTDQCGRCARGDAAGPRRKRGQMIWTHKTAPTIEIEGGPKLTPDDLAAMRRR